MKYLILVFTAQVIVSCAVAQNSRPRESLDLGLVTVWLGEPRSDVEAAFKKPGYLFDHALSEDPNEVVVLAGSGDAARDYRVKYRQGRLSFADRSWSSGTNDHVGAVMGALETLQSRNCRIERTPLNIKPRLSHRANRAQNNCEWLVLAIS